MNFEGQTLFSPLAIKVLLVPIGAMPAPVFASYAAALRQFSSLELHALRDGTAGVSAMPPAAALLARRNWNDGRLWLDMVAPNDAAAAAFLRNSEFEQIAAVRRPLVLLAVLHCPSFATCGDLAAAYREYSALRARYSRVLHARCFAFEPSDADVQSCDADAQLRPELVMFPADTRADVGKLSFYLGRQLEDLFSSFVLRDLDLLIRGVDDLRFLSTPLEPERADATADAARVRKLRAGRVAKHAGDLCLLAGSPKDAIGRLRLAVEQCSMNADFLWHAAALESLATATLAAQLEETVYPLLASSESRCMLPPSMLPFVRVPRASTAASGFDVQTSSLLYSSPLPLARALEDLVASCARQCSQSPHLAALVSAVTSNAQRGNTAAASLPSAAAAASDPYAAAPLGELLGATAASSSEPVSPAVAPAAARSAEAPSATTWPMSMMSMPEAWSPLPPPLVFQRVVADMLEQAIALYAQRPRTGPMRVEALFKLAQYHAMYAQDTAALELVSASPLVAGVRPSSTASSHSSSVASSDAPVQAIRWRASARVHDSAFALHRALQLSSDLSAQDQIVLHVEAAIILKHLDLHRRSAFYLRRAAQLYAEMFQWRAAHQMFLLAASTYRVSLFGAHNASTETADLRGSLLPSLSLPAPSLAEWTSIRIALLNDLIRCAHHLRDVHSTGRYASYLLRWGCALTSDASSARMFEALHDDGSAFLAALTPLAARSAGAFADAQFDSPSPNDAARPSNGASDILASDRWLECHVRAADCDAITQNIVCLTEPVSAVATNAELCARFTLLGAPAQHALLQQLRRCPPPARTVVGAGTDRSDDCNLVLSSISAEPVVASLPLLMRLQPVPVAAERISHAVQWLQIDEQRHAGNPYALHAGRRDMIDKAGEEDQAVEGDDLFLFTPAGNRVKAASAMLPSPATFVARETCNVVAWLCNPLAVPLRIDSLTVLVSFLQSSKHQDITAGGQIDQDDKGSHRDVLNDETQRINCVPVSVTLPPKSHGVRVVLSLTPLCEGTLIIRGIRTCIGSWRQDLIVDTFGRSTVHACPSHPRRGCEVGATGDLMDGSVHADVFYAMRIQCVAPLPRAALRVVGVSQPRMVVCENQSLKCALEIRNTGEKPIGSFRLVVWLTRTSAAADAHGEASPTVREMMASFVVAAQRDSLDDMVQGAPLLVVCENFGVDGDDVNAHALDVARVHEFSRSEHGIVVATEAVGATGEERRLNCNWLPLLPNQCVMVPMRVCVQRNTTGFDAELQYSEKTWAAGDSSLPFACTATARACFLMMHHVHITEVDASANCARVDAFELRVSVRCDSGMGGVAGFDFCARHDDAPLAITLHATSTTEVYLTMHLPHAAFGADDEALIRQGCADIETLRRCWRHLLEATVIEWCTRDSGARGTLAWPVGVERLVMQRVLLAALPVRFRVRVVGGATAALLDVRVGVPCDVRLEVSRVRSDGDGDFSGGNCATRVRLGVDDVCARNRLVVLGDVAPLVTLSPTCAPVVVRFVVAALAPGRILLRATCDSGGGNDDASTTVVVCAL